MKKLFPLALLLFMSLSAHAQSSLATDNFTRANGALGANWTVPIGTFGITSNVATSTSAGANVAFWNANTPGADQYCKVKANFWNTVAGQGCMVRTQSNGDGYLIHCTSVTSSVCNTVKIAKIVSGTITDWTTSTSQNLAYATGAMELHVQGNVLTYKKNGSTVTNYTDAANTFTSGNAGMYSLNAGTSNGFSYFEVGQYLTVTATPSISPATASYTAPQTVTITDGTAGATICYTVDGSVPTTNGAGTCVNGTAYTGTFTVGMAGVNSTTTVKAIATKSGNADSSVASNAITVQYAATPTISPAAGTYFTQQGIALACSTASSSIYFTTDGTPPTTGSTLYAGVNAAPTYGTFTTASTGGTLTGSTFYYYRVSATNAAGETLAATETNKQTAAGTNTNTVTVVWTQVANATGYKVYGRTTGAEQLIATIGSGATVTYTDTGSVTPSGALPTANTSLPTTATSGAQTWKVLCAASGYGDSSVASAAYSIAPADQTPQTDDFAAYYKTELGDSQPFTGFQLPLDSYFTGGKWRSVGAIVGKNEHLNYITTELSSICAVAGKPCVTTAGGSIAAMIANTAVTYSADHFSSIHLHSSTGSGGICVRCDTSSVTTLNGYFLWARYGSPGSVEIGKYVNGTKTDFCNVAPTVADGAIAELRVAGTSIQPLIGGSAIAGCSSVYTDSSLSQGNPGIAINGSSELYGWSGGDVGSAPVTNSTPVTNWSYGTYTNTIDSAWLPNFPWASDMVGGSNVFVPVQIGSTGTYGIGMGTGKSVQRNQYRAPFGSTGQYQMATITTPTWDDRVANWFMPLMTEFWEPGYADGGCAAAGTLAVCNDIVAYYPGVQPHNPYILSEGGDTHCGPSNPYKTEYTCKPFLHITKTTPISSPANQVLLVAGSFTTPQVGDTIFVEYVSSHLRVYCKGFGANSSWQAGHAYSAHDLIKDSNGNLQIVKTAGTSGGTVPGTWASTWNVYEGNSTSDSGVTWTYYGQPCATSTSYTKVIDAFDSDLAGRQGFPGLWQGGPSPATTGITAWPLWKDWSAGTATSTTACDLLGACEAGQSTQWMRWGRAKRVAP